MSLATCGALAVVLFTPPAGAQSLPATGGTGAGAATLGKTDDAGHGLDPSGKPMSAIQWLSKSVTTPAAPKTQVPAGTPGVLPGAVSTSVLNQGPALDAVGLLPVRTTGFPRGLWGKTPTAQLIRLIRGTDLDTLPALQSLFTEMLLAEVDAPDDSTGDGSLLLARIDRLLDEGALDQAQALLELAGTGRADLFRRKFDVSLLLGDETQACAQMKAQPDVAPTFPARIYCLARNGDWSAAALTLKTAEALGFVKGDMANLLGRFLDPALEEDSDPMPPPARPSPLVWRMMEAIGEPMPTTTLPIAFAQADLRENIGWKSQLDAAERLARTGAIPANRLWALYREHEAAASGGVWDRVARVHMLDDALKRGNAGAVEMALPEAWKSFREAELEVPFARTYADRLAKLRLTGQAAQARFEIALLSKDYEALSKTLPAPTPRDRFLASLAQGHPSVDAAPNAMGHAIAQAFAEPPPVPQDLADLVANQQLGAAILNAIGGITNGAKGDLAGVTGGLALLLKVGLVDVARRTALQLMLLDRRG